jgi:hypothetical protein
MRLLGAMLAVLLLAGPASAQLVNENLLVTFPAGYKAGWQDKKPNLQMTELVPNSEAVENWTEMVTIQTFFGMKAAPEQFRDRLAKLWISSCSGGAARDVAKGPQNGYATLTWFLSCPLNPSTGKPEMTWVKGIQGNDSFYVVQKAFKFMPSNEQLAPWTEYLNKVQVCDTRLPDRPCPKLTPVR